MPVFEKLQLWMDPVPRSGPEAMAMDEWLLGAVTLPMLRVYEWRGGWASLGYFGKIEEARLAYPGVELVRRWTGGGMVDHRMDWTYSLLIPKGEALAVARGAASYGAIHDVLRGVLQSEGVDCALSSGDGETGAVCCFENPVGFDLVLPDGRKLAGAGQRRSRAGLLHQGSVLVAASNEASEERARVFASSLATEVVVVSPTWKDEVILARMTDRYATRQWTCRR